MIVIGSSGYLGRPLFFKAYQISQALGTSTSGDFGTIKFNLSSPDDFPYPELNAGDVVILTAAISAPDICSKEFKRAWDINVEKTSRFIEKVLECKARVIFFSSDTVYGECEALTDESAACRPLGEYAKMKREVEERFLSNPLFKTIRLSYVISGEDKFTQYLLETSLNRSIAKVFHPFNRSMIYRDDVIEGVLNLASKWEDFPWGVINFGGVSAVSRADFASAFKSLIKPDLELIIEQPEPNFFLSRPRIINMASPLLEKILGRPAMDYRSVILKEFKE